MTLPNFLVIGAQKAGTTSLFRYLGEHPDVFVPDVKEPHFFDGHLAWHRGLAWYESLFADAAGATAVGEASTSYTMHPAIAGVPERIAGVLPDVRLVYVLRHPVERMRSSWAHAVSRGVEVRSIGEALLADRRYADMSRYAHQLEQYLEWFDRSQILLLTAEDLRDRRAETLQRVLVFLGLRTDWEPPSLGTEFHPSRGKLGPRPVVRRLGLAPAVAGPTADRLPAPVRRPVQRLALRPLDPAEMHLDEDLRRRVTDLVRADVERLRGHLGPTFDGWGIA